MQDIDEMTEPYDDYAEYDDHPGGGRVLWGRFAFWGFMLLFMFFLGRVSAPSADAELNEARLQIAELSEQNTRLQQQLEAQAAGGVEEDPGDQEAVEGEEGEAAEGEETTEIPEGAETYTVQEGDTLNGIAERVYGDTNQSSLIVQANGLDRDAPLRVGQELIIPPAD